MLKEHQGVFKFPSDVKFAAHPSTMKDFERYVDDQDDWNEDYSKAHEKMSLLGQDKSRMTRCTEILPPMIDLGPAFIDKDNGQDTSNSQPDDSYSLKIDRGRLRAILLRLRGYWGFS